MYILLECYLVFSSVTSKPDEVPVMRINDRPIAVNMGEYLLEIL